MKIFLELWHITLTYEPDTDKVKMNHRTKYLL